MVAPTLADLRYAFYGAGEGESVSDAEYAQLLAMYNAGISVGVLGASAKPPILNSAASMAREDTVRADVPTATQLLELTYFTAPRSFTCTSVVLFSGATAAGATPSLVRVGIYTEAPTGDLTLVASIPNDTAIYNAANTGYTRALSVALGVVAGRRYAIGNLVVTAAAAPSLNGVIHPAAIVNRNKLAPAIATSLAGQANLPSSIAFGALSGSINRFYAELV